MGNLFNLSVSPFPHMENEYSNNACFMKYVTWVQAWNTQSVMRYFPPGIFALDPDSSPRKWYWLDAKEVHFQGKYDAEHLSLWFGKNEPNQILSFRK